MQDETRAAAARGIPKFVWGIGILLLMCAGVQAAPPLPPGPALAIHQDKYKPGELLVKFRPGLSAPQIDAAAQALGAREVKAFRHGPRTASADVDRWRLLRLAPGADVRKALGAAAGHPAVERAEPNYEVSIVATPDDPRFAELWGLDNTGQTGGTPDADIDAPEAWDVTTGSSAVVVAVIDTGVDYTHPDLAANIWTNPGEIPGNGLDDDGNGYVDDVHGYDFYFYDGDPMDDHGHGTHVAGTIAAVGNNGIGVAGVSWQARVMAVKFLGADGRGSIDDAVNATLYSVDNGARILSNSWGGGGYSQALVDAIVAADNANVLFVAAAGNNQSDNDLLPVYPASYEVPNVLAVAATDHNDQRAYFSNYGAASVDLGAPGMDILSTVPPTGNPLVADPSGYRFLSGTSMATPHVSGAAALLLAQDPGRGVFALKTLLMETADPIPALAGITASGGRLNAFKALTCTPTQLHVLLTAPRPNFVAYRGEPTRIAGMIESCGVPQLAQVVAVFSNGEAPVTLYDDGTHGDGAAGDGVYANNWVAVNLGPVSISVTASAPALGSDTVTRDGQVLEHVTYRYEPVPYQWIDATGGTSYPLTDESSVSVPIGFDFSFYGYTYSQVTIGSNGILTFGPDGGALNYNPLPNPYLPNAVIAPFWDNLAPETGGIYSLLEGTAPNRRLTVAWVDVPNSWLLPYTTGTVTFEATLYEGSNDMVFGYRDVVYGGYQYFDYGAQATVGVEDQDGLEATQYSYHLPVLQDATALRFYPGPYNARPVANAGPDQTVPRHDKIVRFDGTASYDTDGTIARYAWKQTSGTPFTLQGADTATPYFEIPNKLKPLPQSAIFELTVTDNGGQTASDQVVVMIVNN